MRRLRERERVGAQVALVHLGSAASTPVPVSSSVA
jgi:hypothetical protein